LNAPLVKFPQDTKFSKYDIQQLKLSAQTALSSTKQYCLQSCGNFSLFWGIHWNVI